jgi:hypothetical protein
MIRPWWIVLLALVGSGVGAPALAADCGNEYYVAGAVLDAASRPVANAEVWVLLDKISEKKYRQQGLRARSFRTDGGGVYSAHVVCGNRGGPNPCAKNPKYLTIAADGAGLGMRLKVYKLKDLKMIVDRGACFVEVPPFVLGTSR